MPRPVVAFEANTPTVLALAFREGLTTKSNFGPDQVMYRLLEPADHVTFLDADVAQKIRQLDLAPGERFSICKRKGAERNSAVRWDVWLSPESEKARAARESGVPMSDNGRPAWGAERGAAPVTVTVEDPSDLEKQLEASLADVRRKKAEAAEAEAVAEIERDRARRKKAEAAAQAVAKAEAPAWVTDDSARPKTRLECALVTAVAAAHAATEYARSIGYAAMPAFDSEAISKMAMTLLIGENGGRK